MLKLFRAYLDNCCIGKIYYKDRFICYTVERPWLNNQQMISCIPAGTYKLEPYSSVRYNDVFVLINDALNVNRNTAHRTKCLIHVANFPYNVKGCIGPGLELHPTTWGVKDSRKAMNKLRDLINDNHITKIEIK